MPILTIYHKGGKVTQVPQGYQGSLCHQATRPYADARNGTEKVREGEEGVAQGTVLAQHQQAGN